MNPELILAGIAFATVLLLTITLYARMMVWLLTDNDKF